MKKKSLILIAFLCFMVSGCGKETHLNCTKTENYPTGNTSSIMNITFQKDKIKKAEVQSKVVLTTEEYRENINLLFNALNERYDKIKDNKGVIIKINKAEDFVSSTITVNAKQSPDLVSYVGSSIEKDMSYMEAKGTLENLGYTCK